MSSTDLAFQQVVATIPAGAASQPFTLVIPTLKASDNSQLTMTGASVNLIGLAPTGYSTDGVIGLLLGGGATIAVISAVAGALILSVTLGTNLDPGGYNGAFTITPSGGSVEAFANVRFQVI